MFNNAQSVSLTTKLIVAAGAGVAAKWGLDSTQWTSLVTDAVSLAAIVGATIYAHQFHGNNPPSATPITKP